SARCLDRRCRAGWPGLADAHERPGCRAGHFLAPVVAGGMQFFCAYRRRLRARAHSVRLPVGKVQGVQERLGHLAANAYLVEAARRFTCAGIDQGYKPSVVSAIMKLHATERMRVSVNDAMDIHAGKAVIDGPSNYLGNLYRAVPVAITVEGANILTRSLIVFGQGAIRAHPYLMQEIVAVGNSDQAAGEDAFDAVIWKHLAHSSKNALRAIGTAWTAGVFTRAPKAAGATTAYYRSLNRYAAAFAL